MGIIGLGKMGILHAGIVNQLPNTRVQAVCEKETLVTRIAKKFLPKGISYYEDHSEMARKENLDAIFITTPIIAHTPIIVELAELNPDISLFVEKPLADSATSAERACNAATKLHGIHTVGFQKRCLPLFQKAKKLIDEKSIGDLMFFKAYSLSSDVLREGKSWRFKSESGGVLLDLAPHLLDLLLWLFGEVQPMSVVRRRVYSQMVDDYTHVVFKLESGLSGHMDACWSVLGFRLPETSIEIYGREGNIMLSDDELKVQHKDRSEGTQIFYNQSFDTSVPFLLASPEYTIEDQAFLGSTDKGLRPTPDFFEAAKVNVLIDRIQAASEQK